MKKLLILLFFICVSCGYKPIYTMNDQLNSKFKKIILNGDKKINRQIINSVDLEENTSSDLELLITTNYRIEETSKNTKGQIATYRSIIETQLVIKKEKKIFNKENFSNEFSYNNKDNKYELIKYQNEIKNNLITELINEIILFLKLR